MIKKIERINNALDEMDNSLKRITPGNVAHQRGNLRNNINYIKLLVDDLKAEEERRNKRYYKKISAKDWFGDGF